MLSTVNAQSAKKEFDDYIATLRVRYPPFFQPSAFVRMKLPSSLTETPIPPSATSTPG